jgi:hypothetical protein
MAGTRSSGTSLSTRAARFTIHAFMRNSVCRSAWLHRQSGLLELSRANRAFASPQFLPFVCPHFPGLVINYAHSNGHRALRCRSHSHPWPRVLFRFSPIMGLIGRIRSISRTGITTDPARQQDGAPDRDPRSEAEAMMRLSIVH